MLMKANDEIKTKDKEITFKSNALKEIIDG
jgi:hypothetical protein